MNGSVVTFLLNIVCNFHIPESPHGSIPTAAKGDQAMCFLERMACFHSGKENGFWVWRGIPLVVGKLVATTLCRRQRGF
jgi:hypothetical protein